MKQNIDTGVGFTPAPQFVNVAPTANCVTSAPGLKVDTSAHLTVTNNNTFYLRQGLIATQMAISGVASGATFPALTGPNLAFDNGTVPDTTASCRVYTFFASVSPVSPGTVTITVAHGTDFPKDRPTYITDFYLGDGTLAIIGYLYVKNESSAVFIPGTTLLNVSGITATPSDQFGFPIAYA